MFLFACFCSWSRPWNYFNSEILPIYSTYESLFWKYHVMVSVCIMVLQWARSSCTCFMTSLATKSFISTLWKQAPATHLRYQLWYVEVVHFLNGLSSYVDGISPPLHGCHQGDNGITLGHWTYTDLQEGGGRVACIAPHTVSWHRFNIDGVWLGRFR